MSPDYYLEHRYSIITLIEFNDYISITSIFPLSYNLGAFKHNQGDIAQAGVTAAISQISRSR